MMTLPYLLGCSLAIVVGLSLVIVGVHYAREPEPTGPALAAVLGMVIGAAGMMALLDGLHRWY